ncbi:MAG TPA: hypothetical protein VM369_05750 [Candidatus Binatia bacterium]|nr:hypothetical protein [Candidatus Binatia bacterium]
MEREDTAEFRVTGLGYTTKFNLRNTLELPYTSEFFDTAPNRPHGRNPRLGVLHPAYLAALRVAARAAGPK